MESRRNQRTEQHNSIYFSRILLRLVQHTVLWTYVYLKTTQAQILKKEWSIRTVPEQGFHGPFIATEDDSFTYGYCRAENSKSKSCFVITEKSLSPVVTYKKQCSFITAQNESIIMWPVTLGNTDKHLILSWITYCNKIKNLGIRNIDLRNCNVTFKLTDIKVAHPDEIFDFVWHSNSLDIFYLKRDVDYDKSSDDIFYNRIQNNTGMKFKATFDLEGNKIGDNIPFLSKDHLNQNARIRSIQDRSPPQGYFVHTVSRTQKSPGITSILTVIFMDNNGTRKDLKNFTIGPDYDNGDLLVKASSRVSPDKNTFNLCWTLKEGNNKIDCIEFESNSSRVTNSNHSFTGKVSLLEIYSLPGGGFLMLTGKCTSIVECSEFNVWRVEADGSRRRSYEIVGFEFLLDSDKRIIQKASNIDELVVEIIENLKNEFCLYFYQKREKFTNDPHLRNQVMKLAKFCVPKSYMLP
ncbi:hypothetical protein QAD02_004002 [Eretmocerus hayati]|uniref:Uncharacterized protein n=1 Tax=Eretmocerus hayati TaxID=131215 RepID=A0ACC2NNQ6_9HYME|nr:hypothetical protein QAD02_004002 [Eretmocerus hayati]